MIDADDYLDLVRKIAWHFHKRFKGHHEFEELHSVGVIGLMKAIKKYDAKNDASFVTYASYRIKGELFDYARRMSDGSRTTQEKRKRYNNVVDQESDLENIRNRLGIGWDDFHKLREIANRTTLLSIDLTCFGDKSSLSFNDILSSNDETILEHMTKGESRRKLWRTIGFLRRNERIAVRMYYYEDKSMRQIAEKLGVTKARISQILKLARETLKERMI